MLANVLTKLGYAVGVAGDDGGSDTPVVFLHGVGSNRGVWHPQIDHFRGRRPCFAFDYPGYGESALLPGATRDDFAAAMLAAMDALDINRAHVCGLSLGGVIAIAMHHAAPGRCASLILADTFAIHPDGQAIYDRSFVGSDDMPALATARTPALLGAEASAAIHDEVRTTMALIDPAAFRIGAEAVWLADQRDRVAAIAVPTLVIVGAEDTVTPPRLSCGLVDAIAGAKLAVIPGAGHIANLEQPEAFNSLIEDFIVGVETQA
ncbi:MAG: alpha/beta fold hydrolase [Sphingomicrobium sp.]